MFRLALGVALWLLLVSCATAQGTYRWNVTSGSASFHTAGNWLVSGVPPATPPGTLDDVTINSTDAPGTYTVLYNSVTPTTIASLTLNNATATFAQSAGTFSITNAFTYTTGIYNLSGGTLNLNGGMTMAAGTMTVSGGALVNLSGAMTLNGGTVNLNSGTISGGSLAGGGNRLVIGSSATLSGVSVGLDSLFLNAAGKSLTLTNGTTFAINSTYDTGNVVIIAGTGQSSVNNVTFNVNNGTRIYGGVNSSSWTIGPQATFKFVGTGGLPSSSGFNAYLGAITENSGGTTAGTDRSILNQGTIWAAGDTWFRIRTSGNFTNTGLLKVTNGAIQINTVGTYDSSGGTTEIGALGTMRFDRDVTSAQLGAFTRSTPTTGTLTFATNLTLSGNYDIGMANASGSMNFETATLNGVGFSLLNTGNTTARLTTGNGQSLILNNVNLGTNTIDASANGRTYEFQGGTTFAINSTYDTGNVVIIAGTGQSSVNNVTFNVNNGTRIYGGVNSSSWTIGPQATFKFVGTGGAQNLTGFNAYLGAITENSGGTTAGTDRSILNQGTIWAAGDTWFRIRTSGNFTNTGLLKVTNGAIQINTVGTYDSSGGTTEIGALGTMRFDRAVTSNQLGTISRTTPTTGTFVVASTLTLSANYDIGAVNKTGTITLENGIIDGTGLSLTNASNSTARIVPSGTTAAILNNVNIGTNVITFAGGNYVFRNNSVLPTATQSIGVATLVRIGTGQTSTGPVSWQFANGSFLYGDVDSRPYFTTCLDTMSFVVA